MRILELGNGLSGAFAGMLLRGAGAEVVRVDVAGSGWRYAESESVSPESRYVAALDAWLNSGKRSLGFSGLDAVAAALPALVAAADCVVDDLDAPMRSELGLDPVLPDLQAPWVSVTPLGATVSAPASDLIAAAVSGALIAIGSPDREPLNLPHFYTSIQGGVVAALLAMAAAADPGPPRHIDIASAEVLGAYASINATLFDWVREGHRAAGSGGAYPYALLPAKDGMVCLAVRSNAEWRRMRSALGDPAWARDLRFADVREMAAAHADAADEELIATLAELTVAELTERANAFGCAIAPARSFAELATDADLRTAGVIRDVDSPVGELSVPTFPWFGALPQDARPPVPGEGNDLAREILIAAGVETHGLLWSAELSEAPAA